MNFFRLMILPGFLFLIIIGFGLWVSKVGKPYNNLLFYIHKLIALEAVIFTCIRIFKLGILPQHSNTADCPYCSGSYWHVHHRGDHEH